MIWARSEQRKWMALEGKAGRFSLRQNYHWLQAVIRQHQNHCRNLDRKQHLTPAFTDLAFWLQFQCRWPAKRHDDDRRLIAATHQLPPDLKILAVDSAQEDQILNGVEYAPCCACTMASAPARDRPFTIRNPIRIFASVWSWQ